MADPEAVEALRASLWSSWGRPRRTTDWPTREQLGQALDAALAASRSQEQPEERYVPDRPGDFDLSERPDYEATNALKEQRGEARETLTPEETAEVLAFTGYISAGERDDVVRDLRRARALSSSSEGRDG